jgi:hypothetical protein
METSMKLSALVASVLFAGVALALAARAQTVVPDGGHDFDFNFGVWRTHIQRTQDPLSGHDKAVEMTGTVTVRKVWGGKGQMEEIEADGPGGHFQGATLFLYDPQARQWSQTFASSRSGVLTTPLIGAFRNGKCELYAQDTVNGRTVLVRATWSDIRPDSHHFEEDYSDDGGRTWAPAFIASLTRLEP